MCVFGHAQFRLSLSVEPCSLREARIHVGCVKELFMDIIDLLTSGSDGLPFSFLSQITITNPEIMLTSHTHL